MVVNDPRKDYKTALTDTKIALKCNPTANAIQTVRSSKDGKLLIVTDRDIDAVREIQVYSRGP